MKRHYFISDSLDDLADVEQELQALAIDGSQIHVYGPDKKQRDLDLKPVHDISSFTRSDVVRSGWRGFLVGAGAAATVLAFSYINGWHQSTLGWVPIVFVALILLGFFAWEGGLSGIQQPNQELSKFDDAIKQGKLLFYVDANEKQQATLEAVAARHPGLDYAGDGDAVPEWFVQSQIQFQRFIKAMP